MRLNLKSSAVLAALAILALVPVVEATYMVGYPYVGTTPKGHEARRWALSGFYEGREMVPTRPARVGPRTSILSMPDGERSYGSMKPVVSGTRCLGCELGVYELGGLKQRRGKYYYSIPKVSGRSKFVYTGGTGMSKLTTYGTMAYGTGGVRALPRRAVMRSRLNLGEKDIALLHQEAVSMLGYRLQTGRRCLSCEYETGMRIGRYYATSLAVEEVGRYVPLHENK